MQYTLSTALLRGFVNIDTFTDEAVNAPDIDEMLGKVSVQMVPEIPARFDLMHVEAEVELIDGSVVQTRCDGPRGMWGQPAISDDEHLVKVRDCLSKRLPTDKNGALHRAGSHGRYTGCGGRLGTADDCQLAGVARASRHCERSKLLPDRS